MCKSKLKDISITALLLAGTGRIIHYHYWVLSVTINCHYTCTSCHVYDNKRQRMRLEGLKNLMNTSCSNFSVVSLVLSGRNILPECRLCCTLNGRRRSRNWQHCLCRSSHMRKIRSVWLPPCQWIIVILEHCFSEIIRKFLAHGQRKISMIWLAALGRTIHKAEQLHLLWSGFPGLWWLARWCELIWWHRKSFCIHRKV